MDEPTDHDLLLGTRRGRHDAAARLYARHAPRLLAYARARAGGAGAEDAVQGAMLRVLRTPERDLRAVRDVPAWLTAVVRSTLLNQARTEVRDAARAARAAPAPPTPAPDPPDADDLLRAVRGLSEERREVVLLRCVAGLTFDQLALVLGEPRSTLASRYRAALNDLEGMLRAGRRPGEVSHA